MAEWPANSHPMESGSLLRRSYEGCIISHRFEGEVADDAMAGTVVLGSATERHQGSVNLTQFGMGTWRATRVTVRAD